MDDEKLFITEDELPKSLSKEETYELLVKINEGDDKAKEKLIKHNIRLVIHEVIGRFKNVEYELKDLVSIGNIGLIKAIDTFDINKNLSFSTWAVPCIDGEILNFFKKIRKDIPTDSIENPFYKGKQGEEIKVEDTLIDDTNIAEEYNNKELIVNLREIIKDLPERNREIIMLYFGFYNDKRYGQEEIAEKMSISQAQVSRVVKKIVKEIGKELEERGLIELSENPKPKNKSKNSKEEKQPKHSRTIYEYLSPYKKEEIDNILEKLSEEEKELITLKYGNNLDDPTPSNLNKQQSDKFYSSTIPKIRRLLANPDMQEYILFSKPTVWQKKSKVTKKETSKKTKTILESVVVTKETNLDEVSKNSSIKTITNIEMITKDDYLKILEILRTPSFIEMINMYSPKETVIVSLKLGYINGKTFSTEEVAEFLDIEEQEVIEVTKKALFACKEKINQIIDETINNIEIESREESKIHI